MSIVENMKVSGSYCREMSAKDKLIIFDKKDLNGPISDDLLKSLDSHADEPGNSKF